MRFTKRTDIIDVITHLANNDNSKRSQLLLRLIVNGEQGCLNDNFLLQNGITFAMAKHCYILHEQWAVLCNKKI